MKEMKLVLGCLAAVLLSGCVPAQLPPTRAAVVKVEQAAPIPPTVDLATTSIEFALEIKGDPEPLTQVPGIALDGKGNLLVIDGNNHRLQRFDPQGRSLSIWGSQGDGDGQFQFHCVVSCSFEAPPWSVGGVAIDGEGNVYVADSENSRVQKFDREGAFLVKWGEWGAGDGQFYEPAGIAVDGEGNVYVTDPARGDVQKFDREGRFLTKWGNMSDRGWGWVGPAVDDQGNVYLPNDYVDEIRKFDGEGNLLMTFGKSGRGDGEFIRPVAVAVDHQGNVYVADKDAACIQKFDHEGNFLAKWGSQGTGPGQFRSPTALAVDVDGTIYVGEWDGKRVQKFRQE